MAALRALEAQVLWVSFALTFAFGAIARRTHFCTMGALSDIFNMDSWARMRMWALAIGVAMIGFHGMAWLGWINPTQTIYSPGRVLWLSALVGGAMFGFGMVLASGCGSKTLVRIGEGNLKSLVVFCVMGIAAYSSMRGMTGLLQSKTVDRVFFELPTGGSFPAWLSSFWGSGPLNTGLALSLLVGGGLTAWALMDGEFRASPNHYLGGLGIGATIAAMWWVIGHMAFVPEHPETLDAVYLGTAGSKMQALSFTSPMARTIDWVINFDPGKGLTLGVVSVFGVVLGSFAYSWLSRSFKWEGFRGTQDTGLHVVGALFMGVGGVMAGGCTVGQGLSGMSTLGVSSLIALTGIVLGGVTGLRAQMWLLMRD